MANRSDDEIARLNAENMSLKQALRDMEYFLHGLSETASDMFWRTDVHGRFTYMSSAVIDVAKMPMAEQLGKTRFELAYGDTTTQMWRDHLADLEAYRPFKNFIYQRQRSDGQICHIRTSGRPVFDSDGVFKGYIGVATDITEQITSAAKAEAAEHNLLRALNALNATFSLWDADDRLVIANDHFRELNSGVPEFVSPGITLEEHLWALAERGMLPDADPADEWIAWRMERHRHPMGQFEISRQDGITILVNEARLSDGSTITVANDITPQKQTEMALRESEQRLRDFGNTAADWFWEMDSNSKFTFFSTDLPNVFSINSAEVVGKTRRQTDPQGISEEALRAHEEDLEKRRPFDDLRYFREREDGSRLYISISGRPFYDHTGKFLGYRGVGRDITEMVNIQTELREAKERAEQASRAKSEFLAHMSHELQTPLNAILGFSEIIQRQMFGPVGSESYVEYAKDIHGSGEHLLSLINDLLDLSKIEAGKFAINDQHVAVAEIIEQTQRYFQERIRARNISFFVQIAPAAANLLADRRAMTQMLFNLVSNAEKYNRDGGLIQVDSLLGDDGGIRITIKDTGYGFDVSEIETAISPFGRIQNPMTQSAHGTGLGLPIVESLLSMHGGKLQITSEINVGTTVTIVFPPSRTLSASA